MLKSSDFGKNFLWGVATSAAQVEGAADQFGRGASIWDTFLLRPDKIINRALAKTTCNFYFSFREDIALAKILGFKVFRFSISWSRVLPNGKGKVNEQGIQFYHRVIDECLAQDMVPFVTLYHWDLPETLSAEGGWKVFGINTAFNEFVSLCAKNYGDKVKFWLVLNEPFGFVSLGYMLGIHAPGETGLDNFLDAVLRVAIAQADGGRILRAEVPNARIGTSFSCSKIWPHTQSQQDLLAAERVDALMNRLFLEPALGLGFPTAKWEVLEKFAISHSTWRYQQRMTFDFDFIGLQNYFPLTVKYNAFVPILQAWEVKAKNRKKPHTAMGWEISADGFYQIIKQFAAYPQIKELMISENGAAFLDKLEDGKVHDEERILYFQKYLSAMHRAKAEGVNISGYLVWTLMDNFEWAKGFNVRFGIVHTDFKNQQRTVKDSGYWWQNFLKS